MLLEHFVAGRWRTPDDEGMPLLDAATGDEVARLSTARVPAAEALAYARSPAGSALRELTFHQRAGAIKALALHLMERKDELYEISYATGATKRDSLIDVDGGFGTMLGIASKARRELSDGTVHVDGALEQLGRSGTFVGRHVMTPLRGAAVQINAFNFPVWGMLEKLAPAFIAGMPSIVKPAPQTAYVTELAVRLIAESGLLPDGAVQLLVGDPEGMLDELGGQDVLSFTGSAATANTLRAHPAVLHNAVRFNAEADSLNGCVLGLDADAASEEFDLFVREVAKEMTSKAGQKCTAIRRAFVPRQRMGEVAEALRARLADVAVGDPRDPSTRMGALVTTQQRDAVREAVHRLAKGGRVVVGDPDQSFERGAFLPPLLVAHDDATTPAPHDVEAFGPVATLLPYDDATQVVDLLALGQGSLVGSVVSRDREFVREVVIGAAAHHGRILVLERDDAKESTGHGSPLPHLVHGGPGRAGGGQELGGVRSVLNHLQRTAVQGTPDVLTAITGVYTRGAQRLEDEVHPFRKTMAQLRIGDGVVTKEREVTRDDVDHFATFTGDTFYAHTDEQAAAANPLFGGIVAHGYLVLSLAAGLFVDPAPGPVLANTGLDRLRFVKPVKPGDRIHVVLTCLSKTLRTPEQGEVRWDVQVLDAGDEPVATYELLTMVSAG